MALPCYSYIAPHTISYHSLNWYTSLCYGLTYKFVSCYTIVFLQSFINLQQKEGNNINVYSPSFFVLERHCRFCNNLPLRKIGDDFLHFYVHPMAHFRMGN
ncbi:hypothetical protein CW304_06905 [Bacillus sp. UFRGS-B20]|nr:hypothetical protein CW304_06905 [Bacillus sp. UFRGS-B20]